jgi:tetratricopeptide (TPR) repeat protein
MKIEKLKEQARRHEQQEQWSKALDFYLQAIEIAEQSDEPDISLFNRVGDLQVRVGDVAGAVATYERAIDLYMNAELPNNAIAICQKVIRNVPGRPAPYLKMGQVRARQGFVVDARQNFLTYAEMKQGKGDTEEAFRALQEFVELAPSDVATRLFLAEQLAARGDLDEAVSHFDTAHRYLLRDEDHEGVEKVRNRVAELAPDVTLSSEPMPDEEEPAPLQGGLAGFETTSMGDDFGLDDSDEEAEVQVGAAGVDDVLSDDDAGASDLAFTDFGGGGDEGDEEVAPLPGLGDEEGEGADDFTLGDDVPSGVEGIGDLELEPAGEAVAEDDQDWGFGDEDEVGDEAEATEAAAEEGEPGERIEEALEEAALEEAPAPDEGLEVESAPEETPAGDPLSEPASSTREPPAGRGEGFVDLGSMVLDDERERTTRWKVETEGPSGDEAADFARMLSQFKEKVAENLDTGDYTARYDLGAAYKEMGLLDEAITEFQAALRANPGSLATMEMLGQCFLEKGEPQAAIRTLQRALAVPNEVEDDFLGIYYYLGQCYEATGESAQALEVYEKVFSLDINFKDVTERLRALR